MKFVVSVAPAWAGERVKDKQTDFPRSNAGKKYGDGLRPRFGKHAVKLFFEIGDCFSAVTTIQYLRTEVKYVLDTASYRVPAVEDGRVAAPPMTTCFKIWKKGFASTTPASS